MAENILKKETSLNIKNYLVAVVIGVVVSFGFMLLFSAAILYLNLDRAYAAPFATISIAAGTFFASFYIAKKRGDKGYLVGIITGVLVFAIITVLSLIINRSGITKNTLFHLIIIVLSSTVGGVLGVNKGKNKKYI